MAQRAGHKGNSKKSGLSRSSVPKQLLTTDPAIAAIPWNATDPSWAFPLGSSWAVTPKHAQQWARHEFGFLFRNRGIVAALKQLDCDEIFLLRLDILTWRQWRADYNARRRHDCPPALWRYLLPGREEWGASREEEDILDD